MKQNIPRRKAATLTAVLAAAFSLAFTSLAQAGSCGKEVSAFARELDSRRLPPVAAGPFFPPDRQAERLLTISSLYRAAQNMERLGKAERCRELLAEARSKLEESQGAPN